MILPLLASTRLRWRPLGQHVREKVARRGELVAIELGIALPCAQTLRRGFRHATPHVSERDQADEVQVGCRCRTGVVEVAYGVGHEPLCRPL